jgi:hypothetical protein
MRIDTTVVYDGFYVEQAVVLLPSYYGLSFASYRSFRNQADSQKLADRSGCKVCTRFLPGFQNVGFPTITKKQNRITTDPVPLNTCRDEQTKMRKNQKYTDAQEEEQAQPKQEQY